MNERDLARNMIQRAMGKRLIKLPPLNEQQIIDYMDYRRLPETLVLCDRYPFGTGVQTREDVDKIRDWCLNTLEILREAHDTGELSDADYERLTTPQEYSDDEHHALRDRVRFLTPFPFGTTADGRKMYSLDTEHGALILTRESEGWAIYQDLRTYPPWHTSI